MQFASSKVAEVLVEEVAFERTGRMETQAAAVAADL